MEIEAKAYQNVTVASSIAAFPTAEQVLSLMLTAVKAALAVTVRRRSAAV